jgi:hypothetical protein
MKSKTKKGGKRSSRKKNRLSKLAIAMAALIIIEAAVIGFAPNPAEAMEVLNIADGTKVVMYDTYSVIEPMLVQFDNIRTFYEMAATEMIALLDASETDPLMFPRGVFEFYELASIEMEEMLDFSDELSYFPQVAGASISR